MFISRFNQKWNFWKANEMLFGQVVWRAKPNLWLFGKKKSKYACKWGMHSNDRNPLMSVTMRCCRVCFLVIFVVAKGYMRVGKLSTVEAFVNVSWVLSLECILKAHQKTLETGHGIPTLCRRKMCGKHIQSGSRDLPIWCKTENTPLSSWVNLTAPLVKPQSHVSDEFCGPSTLRFALVEYTWRRSSSSISLCALVLIGTTVRILSLV